MTTKAVHEALSLGLLDLPWWEAWQSEQRIIRHLASRRANRWTTGYGLMTNETWAKSMGLSRSAFHRAIKRLGDAVTVERTGSRHSGSRTTYTIHENFVRMCERWMADVAPVLDKYWLRVQRNSDKATNWLEVLDLYDPELGQWWHSRLDRQGVP